MRPPYVLAIALAAATLSTAPDAAAQPKDASPPDNEGARAAKPAEQAPVLYQYLRPAAEVAGAPKPNQASGLVTQPQTPGGALRTFARVMLFVPKWVYYGVTWPIRQGLYLNDKYDLASRLKLTFFNDRQTFGVYPVALFETGFGLNIGARLIHKDLFGNNEHLNLRASYGGVFRQIYKAELDSGDRLERGVLRFEIEYSIEPDANFYGIGNGDLDDFPTPGLDPYVDDTATRTRFRQDELRIEAGAELSLASLLPKLSARPSIAYRGRGFDRTDDGVPLDQFYDPAAVTGLSMGLSHLYGEVELTYNSHRNANRFVWGHSTGTRASAFLGYAVGFSDDPSNFVRYGLDVTQLVNLYAGNRVLAARLFVEGVTQDRRNIPFVDLPTIGGVNLLRGYDRNRFRDAVATTATLEYQYSWARNLWGFVFADAGRVHPSIGDLSLRDLRLGYGGGVQLQSQGGFQGRLMLASSLEGGLFFSVVLNPAFAAESRTER